jgi:hypothetical protein
MKWIIVFCISIFFSLFTHAQVQDSKTAQDSKTKKTDSIAQKVISFLKNKQPDSVYAMSGKNFREKITPENFNSITTTQILPINNFEKVTFVSYLQGINKYKVDGSPILQLMIGLDAENKIETLLIQPYVEDK